MSGGLNPTGLSYMAFSVYGVMSMNMFGIPLVGADICGFIDSAYEALCTKWHLVGAFYPFSRNHDGIEQPQEPFVWSPACSGPHARGHQV